MIENNETICAFPWRSAAIRPNGLTIPCCRYPHIDEKESVVSSPIVRNTAHWIEIRRKMLMGEKVKGCQSCYQDEANGLTSMRQHSLTEFIPIDEEIIPIEQLEVSFSNLCNLACVHCSSFFSSKWYSEDVKFGRIEKIGALENDFNFSKWDLSNLKELKIIGGEPLMEQKKFIELMEQLDLSKINLQICTNGTVLPNDQLKFLIEQCKKVYLCVSLDGLHSTNDWYRWPSKFSEVVENMRVYNSWWNNSWWRKNKKIVLTVHHVVNAINIFELDKFVEFISTEFPRWKIEWDWIRWPNWQELSVLPNEVKDRLISKFEVLDTTYPQNEFIPNPYKVSVERLKETPSSDWLQLKTEITNLSTERNLDFLNMVSTYKDLWDHNHA